MHDRLLGNRTEPAAKYPEDHEAKIFYASALAVAADPLYGAAHAALLSGSLDMSQKYFGELLTVCAHSDKSGRPEIKEAREALAKQRS